MSENKKEKKLSGANDNRDGKLKDTEKAVTERVTDEEKAEFAEVFNESEDVKAYTPSGKKAKKEKKAADKTMLFKKLDNGRQEAEIPAESIDGEPLSNTRYFNLRGKGKKSAPEKSRKNLMQNFRVLSKNKEDRAILEANPMGKGGKSFADSVTLENGEDVFEAVERTYISRTEGKNKPEEKISARKIRNKNGEKLGKEMLESLNSELAARKKAIVVYGALFAVSLVLTLFLSDTVFYSVVSLLLTLAVCVLAFPVFAKSLGAIKSFGAVPDTAVAVMSFFVLLHNICALILGQTGGLYTACLIFGCLVRVCSDYFRLKNKHRLVEMALGTKSLSSLQRVSLKKNVAAFAGRPVRHNDSDIFYCTRAMLDTSLEEPENDGLKENKYFIFTISGVLIAALAVGAFFFVTHMSGFSFVSAFTAAVCALLPVMYDPLSRFVFYRNGARMLEEGACISGREALTHIGRSDGFVLDADDVFSGEVSRFRKSALSKMDQNDSAVFAALLIREAGSVLAPCFDDFLEQMNIALPPVENFLYEERLGYSAWVLDRKVLVGNRQMLLNHSISVPTKEQEKAYSKNRYVMYVVIDGEITATFLVGYRVLTSLRRYYRDFNKTGMVLMLNSKEAFLDEQEVAAKLSVDVSSVKILSSKATAIMEKYNTHYEKQIPTGLLCSGKKRSIMHLIMGCYNANADDRLIMIMMLAGQLLGFGVLVLSAVLNMSLLFNPVTIVAVRLIWSAVTALLVRQR